MGSGALRDVVLVACAKQKRSSPAPARDLYVSPWFRKARAWAERSGHPWFIVSALHGLLAPEQVTAPYERVLSEYDKAGRLRWASGVAGQLLPRLVATGATVTLLAGSLYAVPLIQVMGDRVKFLRPMQGLGIGRQLGWLTRALVVSQQDSQRGFFS